MRAATAHLELQAVHFSSLAALAPASIYTGTAAYAAATGYLDALALSSRLSGAAAVSIQMANVRSNRTPLFPSRGVPARDFFVADIVVRLRAQVGGQGSGALASDRMASLPGMVRTTLAEYASSLEPGLLSSAVGPHAVLPAPPAAL